MERNDVVPCDVRSPLIMCRSTKSSGKGVRPRCRWIRKKIHFLLWKSFCLGRRHFLPMFCKVNTFSVLKMSHLRICQYRLSATIFDGITCQHVVYKWRKITHYSISSMPILVRNIEILYNAMSTLFWPSLKSFVSIHSFRVIIYNSLDTERRALQ